MAFTLYGSTPRGGPSPDTKGVPLGIVRTPQLQQWMESELGSLPGLDADIWSMTPAAFRTPGLQQARGHTTETLRGTKDVAEASDRKLEETAFSFKTPRPRLQLSRKAGTPSLKQSSQLASLGATLDEPPVGQVGVGQAPTGRITTKSRSSSSNKSLSHNLRSSERLKSKAGDSSNAGGTKEPSERSALRQIDGNREGGCGEGASLSTNSETRQSTNDEWAPSDDSDKTSASLLESRKKFSTHRYGKDLRLGLPGLGPSTSSKKSLLPSPPKMQPAAKRPRSRRTVEATKKIKKHDTEVPDAREIARVLQPSKGLSKEAARKVGEKAATRLAALASIDSGTWRRRCEEEQLQVLKETDPTKAKRIIANRRSAQVSRDRRLRKIQEQQSEIATLKEERDGLVEVLRKLKATIKQQQPEI